MKKLFIVLSIAGIVSACGGGDKKEETKEATSAETKTEPADDLSSNPVYQKGLELVGKSDCLTCHRIDEKINGPSYREIANKYAGSDTAVAYLSKKIISGGGGVWGPVMMAPHTGMSMDDAKALAEYVLLLKK